MNVTSIIDYSQTHLEIINDGVTIYVKKAYIEVRINPDDSRIVDMFWHWYEYNDHQRLFYLDFAFVTTPVAANAAALLALIQGYLVSQYGGAVANASETVKGIVEEATQAELNAGTDTGATGAKLFATPSKLAVWIQQAALTIDAIWHFVSAKLRLFNAAKTFYVQFETAATANRIQTFQDSPGSFPLVYAKSTTNSTTNSTSEANLANILVPANTFTVGQILTINPRFTKTGTTAGWTNRIRIHTSNALAGNLIFGAGASGTFQFAGLTKTGYIKSATDTQFGGTAVVADESSWLTGTALATYSIDWTVDQYIIFSSFVVNAADTGILSGYLITIQ